MLYENVDFDGALDAVRDSTLDMPHKHYLIELIVCDKMGESPSQRELSEYMSAGLSSIKAWQSELILMGILGVKQGVGCKAHNRYFIDMSRLFEFSSKDRSDIAADNFAYTYPW